jgi:hypothetical protein
MNAEAQPHCADWFRIESAVPKSAAFPQVLFLRQALLASRSPDCFLLRLVEVRDYPVLAGNQSVNFL